MGETNVYAQATIRRVIGGWIVYGNNGDEEIFTSFNKAMARVKSYVEPVKEDKVVSE